MMTIKVKCFASMREYLDLSELDIANDGIRNVADVWLKIANNKPMPENTLCAVNQSQADAQFAVSDGDEVAFFPPVTGG